MKQKTFKRGYSISIETGWFKKPIIKITDGSQEVIFNQCGTFTIETNKVFPEPLIVKD